MQKVFDLVPTLFLSIQETQLTNKVTDLLTVPTVHIDHSIRICQVGELEGRGGAKWKELMGWVVLQYELCLTAVIFQGKKKIVPSCNDAVQFLVYILECIPLAEGKEVLDQHNYLAESFLHGPQ